MTAITADSTMAEVLRTFPAAQRALMRRYHIGGCRSCGFAPEDRLAEVLARHQIQDVSEVVNYLADSQEQEQRLQIAPAELARQMAGDHPPRLIDVRGPEEQEIAIIAGALPATHDLVDEVMTTWPKDTPIVTCCHHGVRSLEAASYLIGHGFTDVRSLRGGIDAWAREIDPSMPRYGPPPPADVNP